MLYTTCDHMDKSAHLSMCIAACEQDYLTVIQLWETWLKNQVLKNLAHRDYTNITVLNFMY